MLKLQLYSAWLCTIDQKHLAFIVGDRFRVPPLPMWAGHKVWRYSSANFAKAVFCECQAAGRSEVEPCAIVQVRSILVVADHAA